MKIEFGREICQEFDLGIRKEWIETNTLGGYSSSTIYGLNTRRYHGLFVIPMDSICNRLNIISKLEESIFIENRIYEISTNQYVGGIYPDGYKFLKKFSIDPFPKFYYEVEDRKIEKTIFMLHDRHVLIIRYVLKNKKLPVKLVIKPIISCRKADELLNEVKDGINTDSYMREGAIRFAPKSYCPEFNIYYLKGEYIPATLWYNNFVYLMDSGENSDKEKSNIEDLFNPGFFTYTLEPYDTFELFISLDELHDFDYEKIYYNEKAYRTEIRKKFLNYPDHIRMIAQKSILIHIPSSDKNITTMPSYHWCENSLRESLLLLYGFIFIKQKYDLFKKDIEYMLSLLEDGLFPINFPVSDEGNFYPFADTSLIFIGLVYYIYKYVKSDLGFLGEIYDSLKSIIDAYRKGTRYNIYLDKDNLIYSGDKNTFTGWFPLKDSEGNVLRYGKLLEINAFWYNALKVMEYFSLQLEKDRQSKKYKEMAEKSKESFIQKFRDKKNHRFYDFIRDNTTDNTFRNNQIIPLALTFTMLDVKHGKLLLDQIDQELLTPFGLRTLSAKDKNFIGQFEGRINRKNTVYYNGSVWPWSIGMYVDAVIKYRGENQEIIDQLWKLINNFQEISQKVGIGCIPEIFEGNPPYRMDGTISYSLNTTELFRACYFLKRIEKSKAEHSK
jgi:predicted glycogen debranching enzyme